MEVVKIFCFGYIVINAALEALGKETCNFQTFEARCADNEVVIMTSALYGRMEAGSCIKKDFGFVGCFENVISLAHKRCSGKQSCGISVPDEEMAAVRQSENQCPEDLMKYLAANYTCQPVMKPSAHCTKNERIYLSGKGNLSSYMARKTNCGVTMSPIVLQGERGQVIELTMTDYGGELTIDLMVGDKVVFPQGNSADCRHVYAIIKDVMAAQNVMTHTVCGASGVPGSTRKLMTSLGHQVEIRMPKREDGREFIIQYEVKGCADIPLGKTGTWDRSGNTAFLSCSENGVKWKLVCEGSTWKGEYQNCTTGVILKAPSTDEEMRPKYDFLDMTKATAIVLVCGIAFVVGVFIVVVGVIVLRRRQIIKTRRWAEGQMQGYAYPTHAAMQKDMHYQMTLQKQQQNPAVQAGRQGMIDNDHGNHHHRCPEDRLSREHEYAYVDEVTITNLAPQVKAKPPPVPTVPEGALGRAPVAGAPAGVILPSQDSVSLPDFEHLSQNYSYSTLDSRNFSALERESKRNRDNSRDINHEARYS